MSETRILFGSPLPVWLAAMIGAGLPGVVLALAVRSVRRIRGASRWTVPLCEGVAALILAGLILNPKLIRRRPDTQRPVCGFVVDVSRSMSLSDVVAAEDDAWLRARSDEPPDEAHRVRREQIVRTLLARDGKGLIERLRSAFELRAWRFASELAPAPSDPALLDPSADTAGRATAIGEALRAVGGSASPDRPGAIVLLSDGGWNSGGDPVEAARMLSSLGTKVFTIGIGDPDPPRDAVLTDLRGPASALVGDELLLSARVSATGIGNTPLRVRLSGTDIAPVQKVVAADPAGQPVEVRFSIIPNRPGLHAFTARVEALPGETTDANNSASTQVMITERSIHVLMIESEPRWEYRFLRGVLLRDPGVELTTCLLRPGLGPAVGPGFIEAVPSAKDELAPYDLLILGDVPRRLLPDRFPELAADMVRRRGAALLLIAGRRRAYLELTGTPLADILPVLVGGPADPARTRGNPFLPELTVQGETHLVTRLAPTSEENRSTWAGLPEMHWSAAVVGAMPGATVLLEHPYRLAGAARLPLLVVRRIGRGKTMFCGFEETWRWRKGAGDRYHYRFWAQAVRWLARRPFAKGDPRARLSVDRERCPLGERVLVEVLCLDEAGFPLEAAEVRLRVERDDEPVGEVALEPTEGGWGIYRGRFTPSEAGKYVLRPIVSSYGEEPLDSPVAVEAYRADLERYTLAQNRALLRSIAEAGGGAYLPWQEADRLPELLVSTVRRRVIATELSPCRHPAYYIAMVMLLAAAWIVRRKAGLL